MTNVYISFLIDSISHYWNNIGMLIAITRGLFQFASVEQMVVSKEHGKGFTIDLL